MKLILPMLIVLASFATALAGGDRRVELPIAGMSCDGCASHVEEGLSKLAGVRTVRADHKARRVTVTFDPARTKVGAIRRAIEELGYVIGDEDPPATYPDGADVRVISKAGENVDIEKHLARGRVTIVDFHADWCKPCKALERRIARHMIGETDRLAMRKIDIVDWDSPVAKRYLKDVSGLPYVRIYDARGKHVVSLAQDDVERLDSYLAKLLPKRTTKATRR